LEKGNPDAKVVNDGKRLRVKEEIGKRGALLRWAQFEK
jgi:hypothetical protein